MSLVVLSVSGVIQLGKNYPARLNNVLTAAEHPAKIADCSEKVSA